MNNHEEHFITEFIDEQINQLAGIPDQSTRATTPDARLVHDIRTLCTEDIETRDRVQARLASHISSHKAASSRAMTHELLTSKQMFSQQKNRSMLQQRLNPPAPAVSRLTQVAPILVVTLLVASMVWLFTSARHSNGGTGGKPHAGTTASPQCYTNVAYPDIDLGWQSICLQHEEQVVNQSKPLGHRTLTIEAVYADANRVMVRYSIASADWNLFNASDLMSQLTMQHGIDLPESIGLGLPTFAKKSVEEITTFDAAAVPEQVQVLNLHLTMSLRPVNGPGTPLPTEPTYTASFDFSTPLHYSRIAHLNQTVTAGGIPITLQRVVVSPTQTRFYFSSSRMRAAGKVSGENIETENNVSIIAGAWNSKDRLIYATDLYQEGIGKPTLVMDIYESLFAQRGAWTLHISRAYVPGATADWTFHFTVPA